MSELEKIMTDDEYEYGFHDNIKPVFSTGRGLSVDVIISLSSISNLSQVR